MEFILANRQDTETVYQLVQETITSVYPKYYLQEIVDMFCEFHSRDTIMQDIIAQNVYLLLDGGELVNVIQVYEIMKKQLTNKSMPQLKLRQYKPKDAEAIVSWIKDERALRKWSSDRYGEYPITAEDINDKYLKCNGDCEEADNFYPMTAADETGPVGHLILRYTNAEKTTIRLGFIIVDDSKRGRGYGKRMIQMAIRYAFDMLRAEKITLGVFDNNPSAYYCYKAAGFREIPMEQESVFEILGEQWNCIELELIKE